MQLTRIVATLRSAGCAIRPSADPARAKALDAQFGRRLPRLYRSLCEGYLYAPVRVGEVELFGNDTPEGEADITRAPFQDRIMAAWLREHGYIQFGRPADGCYDPVCFDLAATSRREPAVVCLDHEAILQDRPKVGSRILASNLAALLGA